MLYSEKMSRYTRVWTDGGTSSNVPPYGIGYGSFRIGINGKNVAINFNTKMSANAAEIYTMAHALAKCESEFIRIYSDSRVALKWLKDATESQLEIKESISDEMKKAIALLRQNAIGKTIQGKWRPREQIFKIFGH
jgi:ribonuclease HI